MILRFFIAVVCVVLAAGCSLSVKPKQFAGVPGQPYLCLNYAVPVDIAPPANGMVPDPFLERVTAAASEAKAIEVGEPVSNSLLFLSGGSQHGAFGAGFLDRWAEQRGGLPRFRVVTGISTGALQSTLVFIGEPREIVNRYAVLSESELLEPKTKAHLDGGNLEAARAAVVIAKKGAIAELVPLRRQLLGSGPHDRHALLTDTRLARVADEAAAGRKLFVGAVELDSAKAVAFDLTSMAQDYVTRSDDDKAREALRQCYAEALIASSSVPIAAQPSFIEGKMFIDGGARFGVLPSKLFELNRHLAERGVIPLGEKPNLFMIVNGTLETTPKCDLRKCDGPPETFPPTAADSRAHADWSFPDLAFRSLSVLINQSYISSIELARRDAEWCRREPIPSSTADTCARDHASNGMNVHFVRILPADLASETFAFPVNGLRAPVETDAPFEAASRTCDAWSDEDDRLEPDKPHEFHPRYMRCLIRYGAGMADSVRWWRFEPRPAGAARQSE